MTPSQQKTYSTILTGIAILAGIFFIDLCSKHMGSYNIHILNLIAINAILAVSLNFIYGFTGMFSLGHAGFMAIGAYVCSIFILSPEQKETMWMLEPVSPYIKDLSLPFLFAVIAGGVAATIPAFFISLPILRLGGDYLGIATLGFAEIIRVLITNTASFTNGALGIKGIPSYSNLWWTFGWLLFTLYFINSILKSNVGNVLRAIRDDETAAKTMGVNTFFYKVLSFCIGAFFAGVGGGLTASLISTIDPKMFNFLLTFSILMIVVAGGLGSITGSVVGSVIITVMLEWLRIVEEPIYFNDFEIPGIPGMRMVIFSILLMLIIIFRRSGLMGMHEFSWSSILAFPKKLSSRQKHLSSNSTRDNR